MGCKERERVEKKRKSGQQKEDKRSRREKAIEGERYREIVKRDESERERETGGTERVQSQSKETLERKCWKMREKIGRVERE